MTDVQKIVYPTVGVSGVAMLYCAYRGLSALDPYADFKKLSSDPENALLYAKRQADPVFKKILDTKLNWAPRFQYASVADVYEKRIFRSFIGAAVLGVITIAAVVYGALSSRTIKSSTVTQ